MKQEDSTESNERILESDMKKIMSVKTKYVVSCGRKRYYVEKIEVRRDGRCYFKVGTGEILKQVSSDAYTIDDAIDYFDCGDFQSFYDHGSDNHLTDGESELLDALCRVFRDGYNSPTFPGTPKVLERGAAAVFNLLTDLDFMVGEKALERLLEFYTLYCDPVREDLEDRWQEFGFDSFEHCQAFVGDVDDWK